jgi:hypothetical protein
VSGDLLLNLLPLAREDLARGMPCEQGVNDALHRRTHEIRVQVVRILLRHLRDASAIDRPAHREIDADRETFARLERSGTRRMGTFDRPIYLIAGRVAADLMDTGNE